MISRLPDETIGQRLRRLRKERGLAQRELTGPGVSHAYVSRIEADLRTPSVKAIRKLAAKLGVSPDYLERGLDVDTVEERELRLLGSELTLRLEGATAEAEKIPLEVAEEAARDGDAVTLTRARFALGEAALARGNYRRALESFGKALESSEISPVSDARLFASMACCYQTAGMPERTVTFLRGVLERLKQEAGGDGPARVRFTVALGVALRDLGQEKEAAELLETARVELNAQSDEPLGIRALRSQAHADVLAGRHQAALRKMRKAAILLEAEDESRELERVRSLLAVAPVSSGESK
ncbi:MAG: helix-turn-helix transcriptional regulator [Gaiellaceae bacterium]